MIVKEGEISMDPAKLKGIRDWPIPKTVKQVRSFLGFGNFYRKFIRHYSRHRETNERFTEEEPNICLDPLKPRRLLKP